MKVLMLVTKNAKAHVQTSIISKKKFPGLYPPIIKGRGGKGLFDAGGYACRKWLRKKKGMDKQLKKDG
jgi:hypothetical protein